MQEARPTGPRIDTVLRPEEADPDDASPKQARHTKSGATSRRRRVRLLCRRQKVSDRIPLQSVADPEHLAYNADGDRRGVVGPVAVAQRTAGLMVATPGAEPQTLPTGH